MSKYRVYFKQINADYYDVEAKNKTEAKTKATWHWIGDNSAEVDSIEKLN